MDTDWRPENLDPLGKAMGAAFGVSQFERKHELWLDLRTSENTFAQMVVMKLFYSVRRVVDEAGRSLPNGAAVQGLLFDAARYDRADTIGQNLPIYVQTGSGLVNATDSGAWEAGLELAGVELRTPTNVDELSLGIGELEEASPSVAAVALSADPVLWAVALTGLQPGELECLEGNEGA